MSKTSTADAIKTTLKRVIQKTAEATGNLIGFKITNNITKKSPQNNSEFLLNRVKVNKNTKRKILISRKKVATSYWWAKISINNMIVEYQKIINLLDNTSDLPSKFGEKIRLK